MSTQVSDLYKKHHEVSDNIKSIQESIKDLTGGLDKAKAENKGLQSEIILLVKQIASLEKIVNILNLAQKLRDQKDADPSADVKSGPVVSIPPLPHATPKPVVTGTVATGHGDANTPPSSPKTSGTVDSNASIGTPAGVQQPQDREPYWINDSAKGIIKNPKYNHPYTNQKKGEDLKEDDGTGDQVPPF
jgi:hypothetical protein